MIGGGDWSSDRIIPDCIKAWSKNQIVDIRNPESTRPWQHVLEPLSGYLLLGSKLNAYHGEAFNFGPSHNNTYSVRELIDKMSEFWDQVSWNDTSLDIVKFHEAGLLGLNC